MDGTVRCERSPWFPLFFLFHLSGLGVCSLDEDDEEKDGERIKRGKERVRCERTGFFGVACIGSNHNTDRRVLLTSLQR